MPLKRKWPKNSPRYQASNFTLKEGTGSTTFMQSCGDFLEVYKKDKTFRVQTPESIDPEELNPNIPWVAMPISDEGSSNPIVARVFIQSCELLSSAIFDRQIAIEALRMEFHGIKEHLLECESILNRLIEKYEKIRIELDEKGVETEDGRVLNPFPYINELDGLAASFLIHGKRALTHVGNLPSYFSNDVSKGSNFHKLGRQLQNKYGNESHIAKLVIDVADEVKRIVDLRNYQEHHSDKVTVIENFTLTPEFSIMAPRWYNSDEEKQLITEDMIAIVSFILQVTEALFLQLLQQHLCRKYPFVIYRIPDEEIDDDKPVVFGLTLDLGQFE